MPEQRIRFCAGADGHPLAHASVGEGPPLVCTAWWVSHLEHDWANPRFRAFLGALARHRTVIRYDRAGVGLSDRTRTAFDLASDVADFESLVDHLQLPRLDVLGQSVGGPIALAYAAAHPDRVGRVVLYGTYARGELLAPPDVAGAVTALVRSSWGLGSKVLADLFAPGCAPQEAEALASLQRVACTAETASRLLALAYRVQVMEAAGRVRAPALVLHRRDDRAIPFEAGRELAALVSGAELVVLKGDIHIPWLGDADSAAREILRFLGDEVERPPPPAAGPAAGTASFLREGDVWQIAFAGRRVHLPHAKGLADLARLLGSAGQEVDAMELAAPEREPAPPGPPDPVLDARALASYRRRAAELEAELAQAEAANDLGRRDRLLSERELILDELGRATRPGGRSRAFPDGRERARKAVSARVRQSLVAIRAVHPDLADHLERSVVLGVRCSYAPAAPVEWRT